MSETLRDLVVSLSLQTDNFTRNIKSVSKQIAEAESQFKLAAAGVEGFEHTATGLATQLSTLERRLSLQKDAVNQYQRALEAANNKLSECYNRQNDYGVHIPQPCPGKGNARQHGSHQHRLRGLCVLPVGNIPAEVFPDEGHCFFCHKGRK